MSVDNGPQSPEYWPSTVHAMQDELERLRGIEEQLEGWKASSLLNAEHCKRAEEQLETTRAVLAEARRLAIRVADKNIGPLSDHAREVQGAANDVLNDLPTFEEVAGLLANSSPASVRHDSASTTEGGD